MTNRTVLRGSMAHKYKPISFTNCTLGNKETRRLRRGSRSGSRLVILRLWKFAVDSRLSGSGEKGEQVELNSSVMHS